MNALKAVLLDFDGIILESVDVKGWVFGKLFERYPDLTDTIVDYHLANGGVSRFEKFKYIYKEFLHEPLTDEEFQRLCAEFSQLVFERVLECEFVKGALEFLEKYYQVYDLFIISGTPDEEMKRVVKEKGLEKYYKGVFGSPQSKGYWTKHIMDQYQWNPENVLWVGDALSDQLAAQENNVSFVGRIYDNPAIFEGNQVAKIITDLFGLDEYIQGALNE